MTDPLVPPDVDLRDFAFMPLYGDRLFKSDTWILCDDAERVAALRLWWASWHQEPAGSLPNNDKLLSEFAGYGVAVKAFLAVKINAMRGWIECSDGRLYHPVVCEVVLESWAGKRKKAEDNAAERERKRRKRASVPADKNDKAQPRPPDTPILSAGHTTGSPAENALKGSRRDSSVPPSLTDVSSVGTAAPCAADAPADDLLALPLFTRKPPDGDWKKLLFDAALPWLAQDCGCKPDTLRPLFGRWLRDASDDAKRVYDAVAQAQAKQPADPRGWITAQLGGSNARRTDPRYRDHDQFRAELAAAAAEQLDAELAAAGGG